MSKQITNKADFDSAVIDYRGPFPVLLTTDGESLYFEHDCGSLDWKPKGVVIDVINNEKLWPDFSDASRCRVLAKTGWRGKELKQQITEIQSCKQLGHSNAVLAA